jgi:CelD/BcsL family acetyltransferase involved in cellulose biosynthesis
VTSRIVALDDPEWQTFVSSRPEATPFHHPSWAGLLAECYGLRGFAVAVFDGAGTISAGVPVIETRGLRSRSWVALPFTDECGTLGDVQARMELVAAFDERRTAVRVPSGEIREPIEGAGTPRPRGVTHTLRLTRDPESLRRTFDRSQVQRSIARAEREHVCVREADTPADLVEIFYRLHLATRKRQGVPIQPRRFFELLWERFISRGLGWVLIAEHEGRAIGAAVFLSWNRHLVYKFGASDATRRSVRPIHAIFWYAIRRGCDEGSRTLDFGRSETQNRGLRDFKAGWGTVERELVYTHFGEAPRNAGPSLAVLSRIIRHSPAWVCQAAGERLYRYAG